MYGGLQRDPQKEAPILNGEAVNTAVPLRNGTDAPHADSMPRLVRDGNPVLKADSIHAVIDHLKKELAALFVGLHLNAAALAYLLRPPSTGVQRVFKSVGQQHAKVAFGQRQSMGQLRVDGQGNPLCGGPPRKGGKNQIGGRFRSRP